MTERLDVALVTRGLVRSRTQAAQVISNGLVSVSGATILRASHKVAEADDVTVDGIDHYVSRAAHKLLAALDVFGVDVTGRSALDVGASTGGFTQVLLERGARSVIALDVGHGQLAETIRQDPRVTVVEGFNARELSAEAVAKMAPDGESPSVVVGDVSFISLTHLLGPIVRSASDDADLLLLVKPQFEVGRESIREGVVHRPALRERAVCDVLWAAWDEGLGTVGVAESPLVGNHGNHEYLIWLRRVEAPSRSGVAAQNPTEWLERIATMTGV